MLAFDPGPSTVGGSPDRIERDAEEFHARVAAGYEELAALFPERLVLLDGTLDPETLADRIQDELQRAA